MSDLPTEVSRFAALSEEEQAVLLRVHDLIRTIPYGTIELVLHQGDVVQIETSEKFKMP